MCGLVGVSGDLEFDDEGLIKRLLVLDYFRGPHSTGFASVKNNGETSVVKIASHPMDLFDSKSFEKALSGYNSQVFMGHNRYATIGKINATNAHPFEFGDIIGTHNGTLDNESWKRLEEALGRPTSVDSEAIFACIDKIGIEKTVSLMQEGRTKEKGAWALVWTDAKDGTINFLRNKHRPLWYAFSEKCNKIIWASEHPMIYSAAEMSKTDYPLWANKSRDQIWSFNEDWWYSLSLEDLIKGGKDRPKMKVKELKGISPPAYDSSVKPPFRSGNQGERNGKTTTSTIYSGNVVEFPANDKSPWGKTLTIGQFNILAAYGCSWCSSDIDYGEVGTQIRVKEQIILCPTCTRQSKKSKIYLPEKDLQQLKKGA